MLKSRLQLSGLLGYNAVADMVLSSLIDSSIIYRLGPSSFVCVLLPPKSAKSPKFTENSNL